MHSKLRNRLTQARADKLLRVYSNSRLKVRALAADYASEAVPWADSDDEDFVEEE